MRLKNPQKVSVWNFTILTPSGEELTLPVDRPAPNRHTLVNLVMSHINAYDNATQGEYSKEQRKLAAEANLTLDQYIGKLIEHQMCLRMPMLGCWNEGVGDSLHNAMKPIDGFIERTPDTVKTALQSVIRKITPSRSKTLSGCSACGGTRVFNPNEDNLGRAGKVNKFFKR